MRIDVNDETKKRHNPLSTELIDAVISESKEMVEQLINQGADVNATDVLGMSPLAHAAGRNLKEIAELLISRGADVNGGPLVPRWGNPLIRSIKGFSSADISLRL
ncbi:MAG: ankyrin repeat domain-containing protein, partial [Treponema sp.]|nr:ankyrin repeat domain-containing protein [Treponema sp.]